MKARLETATIHDLVLQLRNLRVGLPAGSWTALADAEDLSTVSVHGAHPGAGASTITVALADVCSRRGALDVSVVDLAAHEAYGASEAIEVRTDLGLRGWKGGRRGGVRILRLAQPDPADKIVGDVVVDACGQGDDFRLDVLVCRATVPSIRRVEPILAAVSECAVAVVGARKWPTPVRSSFGPLLVDALSSGRVVFFPHEPTLERNGLSAAQLPPSTLRAAGRLLDLLPSAGTPTPHLTGTERHHDH